MAMTMATITTLTNEENQFYLSYQLFRGNKMKSKEKIVLGQFFTKENSWLKTQVVEFIIKFDCKTAFDPFAGGGHLLESAKKLGIKNLIGMDIDTNLGWKFNDSLISIPHIDEQTIIITNPPYLSNYSASRKKIMDNVRMYFNSTNYDDLYLLALDNMLKAQKYVVAIIPETFINSNYKQKYLLNSITILEDNPFDDTDTPVIVACFDGKVKPLSQINVYKNETLINDLDSIENMRLCPNNSIKLSFNDPNGWLAVRCVDSTNPNNMLKFDLKTNINYNWECGIKVSSRLLTLIGLDIPESLRLLFIAECNNILNKLRKDTGDIILSPFKGNMKNGTRRRRLDFRTCRAIIEIAYKNIMGSGCNGGRYGQLSLF